MPPTPSPAIGSPRNPIELNEPMKIARAMQRSILQSGAYPSMYKHRGELIALEGGEWRYRDDDWLEGVIWEWMEDRVAWTDTQRKDFTRLKPSDSKVRAVRNCLIKRLVPETPWSLPHLFGAHNIPSIDHCITLQDVVVNISLSAKTGKWELFPRTPEWVETCVIPYTWEDIVNAPTPSRWEQALTEWGNDPVWSELLERAMAYSLMATRKYGKWFLLYGKIRGGKGTIQRVLTHLVGRTHMFTPSLDDMADTFALDGIQRARVMFVSEVSRLDYSTGAKAARVLKQIVGEDTLRVRTLYKSPTFIVSTCVCFLSSNEIPVLPNKGEGLSSKMVLIPFDRSFLGKEEYGLDKRLIGESPGIMRRLLEAAIRLEREPDPALKWTMPTIASRDVRIYELTNNAAQGFLESRFITDTNGFVETAILWSEFLKWKNENHVNLRIPKTQLTTWLRDECGRNWHLTPGRRNTGGVGLWGLRMAKTKTEV